MKRTTQDDEQFTEAALAEYCRLHGLNADRIANLLLKHEFVEGAKRQWTQEERELVHHLQQIQVIYESCRQATPWLKGRPLH